MHSDIPGGIGEEIYGRMFVGILGKISERVTGEIPGEFSYRSLKLKA